MDTQYKSSAKIYHDVRIRHRSLAFIALSLAILGGCASDKAEVALRQDREALQLQLDKISTSQAEQLLALNKRLTELGIRMDASEADQKKWVSQNEARLSRLEKAFRKPAALRPGKQSRPSGELEKTPKKSAVPTVHKIRRTVTHKSKPGRKTGKTKKPVASQKNTPSPPPKKAPVISGEEIRRIYIKAYLALKSGHYDQASTELRSFLAKFPASKYVYQASYWLGESLHAQGKTTQAVEAFRKAASAPNEAPKQRAALLRLGQLYNELGNTGKAKATLLRLTRDHPQSPEAETARKILSGFAGKSRT